MTEEKYVGFFVDWIEQWSQFFGTCNWYTFNFIQLEFEDDRIMGGMEITFVALGLGLRARWNYRVTPAVEKIREQVRAGAGCGNAVETPLLPDAQVRAADKRDD